MRFSPGFLHNFRTTTGIRLLAGALVTLIWLLPGTGQSSVLTDYDSNRAKLLGYVLRQQLAVNHFSHKSMDDQFSEAAFDLYLKQLDAQKRFLLEEDVALLEKYSDKIDDELNKGEIELPLVGARILRDRVKWAEDTVGDLLKGDFDFTREESLETDPEKIVFCTNQEELRERWRKTLKYQVMVRYLNLMEDEESKDGNPESEKASARTKDELRAEALEKVRKSYRSFFERILEEDEQDHYDRFFNAVTRAFDPHTNYLPPTQKEDFDIGMRGSLEGIGATLQEEDGYIKVVRIIPGSAAYRQGDLESGDLILMVGEKDGEPVDITDTRIRDAVKLIRGKKGTEVRLTVRKADGIRKVIPIVRDVVQIEETFVKSTILKDDSVNSAYGYIKIPAFYRDFEKIQNDGAGRNSTEDTRAELLKLKEQGIKGLVLDLRNNGGGALTDAVAIAGLFIEKGPVVQVKDSDGDIHVLEDEDSQVVYDGPVVILVNRFSASASEILAGALQDYNRALIVGSEHTHGKGTVQAMMDLDRTIPFPNMNKYKPLGALKVTIQKFYRVSGDSTQYRGVVPDIILPDRFRHLKSGERHLDFSLPWDKVEPTNYRPWSRKDMEKETLASLSRDRIESDPDFLEIREETALVGKKSENTLQSLDIEDIQREREEAKLFGKEDADSQENFHAGSDSGEKEKPLSDDERREKWIKSVSEDPYVKEVLHILNDFIFQKRSETAVVGSDKSGMAQIPVPGNPSAYSRKGPEASNP